MHNQIQGGEKTGEREKEKDFLIALVAIQLQKLMRDFARREGRLLGLAGVDMQDRVFVLDLVKDACDLMKRVIEEEKKLK